ncbi:TPA: hypothetical protein DCE37_14655, partial [Candidatus Latescibacteria bacterium]|nr:hypothetical protein [Candidatus Latescibacterota bacterium]
MVAQYYAGWVFGIGAEFEVGGDFEVVETVEDGPGCQDVVEASDGFGAHEGLAIVLDAAGFLEAVGQARFLPGLCVRGMRDVVEVALYDDGMAASQVIGGHFGNEAHFLMDHFGAAAGGGVE